jgi:hypothetical protein
MSVRQRQETLPFYDAIHKDYTRSDKGYFVSHLYVDLGLYGEQLRRYLNTFGPKNVKILMFEEFIKDTQAAVSDVLQFLGLETYVPSNLGTVYDPYLNPTKRTRMVSRLSKIAFHSQTTDMAHEILKTARRAVRKNSDPTKASHAQELLKSTYKSAVPEDGGIYLNEIYRNDVIKLKSILGRSVPWPNFME